MSRKFGKFLLFSAVAGAVAYGAYHYLQNKEKAPVSGKEDDTDDDFDDFSEDLDEDACAAKDRAYVSLNLDKAEAFASEAFHKAKEVIADSVQQVRETVKSVAEGQPYPESSFTDLTDLRKSETAEAPADSEAAPADADPSKEAAQDMENTMPVEEAADVSGAAQTSQEHSNETVEDFFDDEM